VTWCAASTSARPRRGAVHRGNRRRPAAVTRGANPRCGRGAHQRRCAAEWWRRTLTRRRAPSVEAVAAARADGGLQGRGGVGRESRRARARRSRAGRGWRSPRRDSAQADVDRVIEGGARGGAGAGQRDPARDSAGVHRGPAARHLRSGGMTGTRLEVDVFLTTMSSSVGQNLRRAIRAADRGYHTWRGSCWSRWPRAHATVERRRRAVAGIYVAAGGWAPAATVLASLPRRRYISIL